jgi:hypothetical protein
LNGSVTPLSQSDAPLSSADKVIQLIEEGLIPPLPQSQWLLDAMNGPMPDKDWWKAKDSLEASSSAGVAVMDAGDARESAGVPGQAVMVAGDALNTPLPPSPFQLEGPEGRPPLDMETPQPYSSTDAGTTALEAGMDIVTSIM